MKKFLCLLMCIWMFSFWQLFAQKIAVKGKVTDASTKEALPGATVAVKGTTIVIVTDSEGNYSLTIDDPNSVLKVSYIGYNTEEVAVNGQKSLDILLTPSVKSLDEVVVVGYGVQKKSDVTGAMATLSNNNFNKGTVVSATELMAGHMSGVQITQVGGEPGAVASVRIRGNSSFRANNDPLYVIDGVPFSSDDPNPSGGNVIAGMGNSASKNPLNFLNTEDIESIDVLKDASATAIYGSRGANGVVMITTKKGKQGKGTFEYSGNVGISVVSKELPIMSPNEYRKALIDNNLTALGYNYGSANHGQSLIFQTATSQNHSLSFSAGSATSSFRVSFGYSDIPGIIKNTGQTRYTTRINGSSKVLNERLTLDVNLTVSQINDMRTAMSESGSYEGNLIISALKFNPTLPITKADGSFNQPSPSNRNPVAMLDYTDDRTKTLRAFGNLGATLNIIKGLDYRLNIGLDNSGSNRRFNSSALATYFVGGYASINQVDLSNRVFENYLTYSKVFGKHDLKLMAGYSYETTSNVSSGESGINFLPSNPLLYTNAMGAEGGSNPNSSAIQNNALQSFFTRLNYNFENKYLLTFTMRRDGSTKFGENRKYGTFPSAAFAWKLQEENFIKNLNVFSDLKLRLCWGKTGNQAFPNKLSQPFLASGAGTLMNGHYVNGISVIQNANPNLQWEENVQTDIGLDFAFLKGRLSGSMDYYSRITNKAVMQLTAVAPSPFVYIWENLPSGSKIENSGFELNLNGVIINQKDLTWSLNGNITFQKNNVSGLPGAPILFGSANGQGMTNVQVQRIVNGSPIGEFYGKVFTGFDASGNSVFANGEASQNLGSPIPNKVFGFGSTLNYKKFDINIMFNGVSGNKIFNNTSVLFNRGELNQGYNTTLEAAYSKESLTNSLKFSSRYIEDGSFLRLSNITAGYTFTVEKWKNYVKSLRVFVTGQNLFVITKYTGYDPEVNSNASKNSLSEPLNGPLAIGVDYSQYPRARTVTFGVTMSFN